MLFYLILVRNFDIIIQMIALKIFCILIYIIAMSIMVMYERDKPRNIIIWSILFLLTSIVGYIIYTITKLEALKKVNSLSRKQNEDEIYLGLINKDLRANSIEACDSLFKFNTLAHGASLTENNTYELISDYQKFKTALLSDIKSAKSIVLLELYKVLDTDFAEIKDALIKKSSEGVKIKLVYEKSISHKLKKELIKSGIRVVRFSKHNVVGGLYSNLRNIISIDGETVYIANMNYNKIGKKTAEIAHAILKIKGDVVQDINLALFQDVVFAGGKFIDFKNVETKVKNNVQIQYISTKTETNIELVLIKAISSAKSSIQLQLDEFIPTESIMSLLKFAINSNIDVRLMVPLKTNKHSKYFASRAYAKELALAGANVYLFDGYIKFNSIIVDDQYVLTGSYVLDREHIVKSLQNVIIIKDDKAVNFYNKYFDKYINNSYRISNAKFMLLREIFFKNFV